MNDEIIGWDDSDIEDLEGDEVWGNMAQSVTDGQQDAPKLIAKRRQTACYEISEKTLYRRAYGTTQLCEAIGMEVPKQGHSYHIITGGNVDSIAFLKYTLLHQDIDYVMASTWNMAGEDILQIEEWLDKGRIKCIDIYVGDIQVNNYRVEWRMLNDMYQKMQEKYGHSVGRLVCFKNHSKVYAGWGKKFPFVWEGSANINSNPRTEQVVFTIDRGLADYYKSYYDRIQSYI